MPITPTVFRAIRSNDVHQRPFRAYKQYKLTNSTYSGSGAAYHKGLYTSNRIDLGDSTVTYPTNTYDGSNQHIIWKSINHRYYQHPYDPALSFELTDRDRQYKFLDISASIITLPYLNVGERIKPSSVQITATPVNRSITLTDDGLGNLRDGTILTSSFANNNRNFFHLSVNNEFRKFPYNLGTYSTSSIAYVLNNQHYTDGKIVGAQLIKGISTTGVTSNIGRAVYMPIGSYIRIPHHDTFNNFQKCDNWTISFWYYPGITSVTYNYILSKYSTTSNRTIVNDGTIQSIDKINPRPDAASWDVKARTPFTITSVRDGDDSYIYFHSSDGSKKLTLQSDVITFATDTSEWVHICVRNSASLCEMFIDGVKQTAAGALPVGNTNNNADIFIGKYSETEEISPRLDCSVSEIRMYDYAASAQHIQSLANAHFISASCLQTNVAGNVFYRNGQIVVSSALPKYNSGSGFFNNTWNLTYKGQHTIYENEVLVRVPADQLNISTNPSATYRLATGIDNSCNTDANFNSKTSQGELRKPMFIDGTARPYVTTIGLYNDAGELVVIGKLASPVQKRDDIDMNFIVRWDH